MLRLDETDRLRLATQRMVGQLLAPLWIFTAALVLRFVCGYRIEGRAEKRRRYQAGEPSAQAISTESTRVRWFAHKSRGRRFAARSAR